MFHNKLNQLALALILACTGTSVSAADNPASTADKVMSDLSFDIDNIYTTLQLESLASQVVVYTNSKNNKFFTVPYLLPNWKSYKEQLDKLSASSPQTAQIHEIKFPIRLVDKIVQDEILGKLNSYQDSEGKTKKINSGDLGVVPFVSYQIKVNLGGQERLVYSNVDLSTLNNKLIPTTALGAANQVIGLKGTLEELSEFYKDRTDSRKITGTLYSAGYTFDKSELTGKLEILMSSDRTARLLRDEKLEMSKMIETTTGKVAGGLSVNLGFVSFGGEGGKSTTTTTEKNSTQRIMSGSFVSDLVRENASALKIDCVSSNSAQCDQWIEKISDFFLKESSKISVELKEQADGSYQLGNKELGYATLGKLQADELIKTKNNLSTDMSAVSDSADNKAEVKHQNKITFDDDIEWEFKGDRWIPTKVDLYVVDTARLKEAIQLSITIRKKSEEQEIYSVPFNYPAANLDDQAELWQQKESELSRLNDTVNTLNNTIATLNSRINNASSEPHAVVQGEYAKTGFEHVKCWQHGGNLESHIKDVCGERKVSGPTQVGVHSGNTCGYNYFVFWSCIQPVERVSSDILTDDLIMYLDRPRKTNRLPR